MALSLTTLRIPIAAVACVLAFSAAFYAKEDTAAPAPKFKVGDTAPDFTLKNQEGKEVSLHDFRGKKKVVLAFYIFAFTGG